MGRFDIPDHPEIACIERTGYPSWMQEDEDSEDYERELWGDEDRSYEERREREIFGDW